MDRRAGALAEQLRGHFGERISSCVVQRDEVSIEVVPQAVVAVCTALRDGEPFAFDQLMDLCGVDYATHGSSEWITESATDSGFGRGVDRGPKAPTKAKRRFAVVYHLLSTPHNRRLRIRAFLEGEPPVVDSVVGVWASANWFEREAFDLFGILFDGHPDLRRILTDYGFVGYPFRKDFPLSGHLEMRYDPDKQRVVYEPVSIEPRVLVPRVVRYEEPEGGERRDA
jgi:NADH-quinone oxidoreductase subunit C